MGGDRPHVCLCGGKFVQFVFLCYKEKVCDCLLSAYAVTSTTLMLMSHQLVQSSDTSKLAINKVHCEEATAHSPSVVAHVRLLLICTIDFCLSGGVQLNMTSDP